MKHADRLAPAVRSAARHRRGGGDRGQAFAEFTLILPIALVLIFGVIDIGKAISYWLDSGHLANIGARYAVVNGCPQSTPPCLATDPAYPTNLLQSIKDSTETPQLKNSATFCLRDVTSDAWQAGDHLRMTITSPYDFIPFLDVASTTRTLTGRSAMRLEQNWATLPTSNPYGIGPAATSCNTLNPPGL